MRRHGPAPYTAAVLHGGPGAAGEVRPLAEALARRGYGTLEPLQTKDTIAGQIAELADALADHAPVDLIGWSWGAWLALLTAAAHPEIARHVILVGSGPVTADHAKAIRHTRLARLSESERQELETLKQHWDNRDAFARSLALYQKMDAHTPDRPPYLDVTYDQHIHRNVWAEASKHRQSGALLQTAARVACPLTILHGDHDPHPADGVVAPLRTVRPDTQVTILDRCGHKPWEEAHARAPFFDALISAVKRGSVAPPAQI
ncbi:MAG: alpha/beta hydrolase [Pseudomonadota bacterium]